GPALAPEDTTGDHADGVLPLFEVDRQGEEVDAFAWLTGAGGGDEHDGVAVPGDNGAARLTGQAAGFEGERSPAPFLGYGVCHWVVPPTPPGRRDTYPAARSQALAATAAPAIGTH